MYEWQAIKQMKSETINEVSKGIDLSYCSNCKCDCGYVKIVNNIASHIIEVRKNRPNFGLVK